MGCSMNGRVQDSDLEVDENPLSSWEEPQDTKRSKESMLWPTLEILIESPKEEKFEIDEMVRRFSKEKAVGFSSDGIFGSDRLTLSGESKSLYELHLPITKLTSQLYFGSYENAKNEEQILAYKITHIISLIGPTHLIKDIKHMHYPINDYGRTNLKEVLIKLWPFIKESQQFGNSLFVHCMSGQNRSATLVIAILMRIYRKGLKDVSRYVKKKRPLVQINEQYAKQLHQMEYEIFGQTSMPDNWMEIRNVDMNTGNIYFVGEKNTTSSTGGTINTRSFLTASTQRKNLDSISDNKQSLHTPRPSEL